MASSVKVVVYAPETHADDVRWALGEAGAGTIGTYTHCTFTTKGTGRFVPQEGSDPHDGVVGKMSAAQEERIETVCDREQVASVIDAVRRAHPYEEPAIDVYPLEELPA